MEEGTFSQYGMWVVLSDQEGNIPAADRIMVPKDIHVLILKTHEDLFTLHSKRDFADMIKYIEMTLST